MPFPCVVYTKRGRAGEYAFSHYHPQVVPKATPQSLRVSHLRDYAARPRLESTLRRSCFLVLVTGDVAQCITTQNVRDNRTRFLFKGSEFARSLKAGHAHIPCSEFHEDFIPLNFYSTLTSFVEGAPTGVTPLECGIALFPRSIHEKDLETLGRWVEHNITKSVHGSVWITNHAESYSEHTLVMHGKGHTITKV